MEVGALFGDELLRGVVVYKLATLTLLSTSSRISFSEYKSAAKIYKWKKQSFVNAELRYKK